ncbi:hypothetical protein B0H11DRAFT_2067418 [Mycena galericulata]|nr:hypothetical protein B0H11DRAFT_2067418 [Mycena galericulata]
MARRLSLPPPPTKCSSSGSVGAPLARIVHLDVSERSHTEGDGSARLGEVSPVHEMLNLRMSTKNRRPQLHEIYSLSDEGLLVQSTRFTPEKGTVSNSKTSGPFSGMAPSRNLRGQVVRDRHHVYCMGPWFVQVEHQLMSFRVSTTGTTTAIQSLYFNHEQSAVSALVESFARRRRMITLGSTYIRRSSKNRDRERSSFPVSTSASATSARSSRL